MKSNFIANLLNFGTFCITGVSVTQWPDVALMMTTTLFRAEIPADVNNSSGNVSLQRGVPFEMTKAPKPRLSRVTASRAERSDDSPTAFFLLILGMKERRSPSVELDTLSIR